MNAARLSHPLSEAGLTCSYFSFSQRNEYLEKLHPQAEFFAGSIREVRSSTLRLLRGIPRLAQILRSRRHDLVVPVLEGAALATVLASMLVRHRTPIIVSVQNAYLRSLKESGSYRAWAARHLWSRVYGAADGAIALSHGVARDLIAYVPGLAKRVRTVPNVGLMDPIRQDWQPDRNGLNQPLRIAACGRLDTVKDYPTMLRAFARVRTNRDARLDIVGEGPLKAELVQLAERLGVSSDVTFHGYVGQPQEIIRRADIFVLSSVTEGFGNVIIEAMAVGVPVVATDCPYGPGEILQGGEFGVLAPVGDSERLSEAILRLAEAPELRATLSTKGKQRAADFTPAAVGGQFMRALSELAPGALS
jgi:glycosyltransferase involved in cell wall biosynthesis